MIKKILPLSLFIVLLALLEAKMRLWSGFSPNFLLVGLIGLAGILPISQLVFLTLLGFLVLAGPIISQEILMALVIISFVHFLRLFVVGQSPLLIPAFSITGLFFFYLGTVGTALFSSPLFLAEMVLVGGLASAMTFGIIFYLEAIQT